MTGRNPSTQRKTKPFAAPLCPPQAPQAELGRHVKQPQPVKTGPHKSANVGLPCVNCES
jgi:hypothetical protein